METAEYIKSIARSCKGKRGLMARKMAITLGELDLFFVADATLRAFVDDVRSTHEEAVLDFADMQFKIALIAGEKWALSQMRNEQLAMKKMMSGMNSDTAPAPVKIEFVEVEGRVVDES